MRSFDDIYESLIQWTESLAQTVASSKSEVQEALQTEPDELPRGCPSSSSLAATVFEGVLGKLVEVKAAVRDVRAAIWQPNPPDGADEKANTLSAFLEAVQKLSEESITWFRGQADSSWTLQPAVERPNFRRVLRECAEREFRGSPSLSDSITLESRMFGDFMERGYYLLDPNVRGSLFDMYLQAQHHGLPTRLLDWTRSCLAALFFAVRERAEADGLVFVLPLNALWLKPAQEISTPISPLRSRHKVLTEGIRRVMASIGHDYGNWESEEGSEEPLKDLMREFAAIPVDPRSVAGRVTQQSSTFTLHLPKEFFFPGEIEYKGLAGAEDALSPLVQGRRIKRIIIPRESKSAIRSDLERAGVTLSTLFPDLENLSRHLMWERKLS